MNRLRCLLTNLCFLFGFVIATQAIAMTKPNIKVFILTDNYLAVNIDYSKLEEENYLQRRDLQELMKKNQPQWKTDFLRTFGVLNSIVDSRKKQHRELQQFHKIRIEGQNGSDVKIVPGSCGFWITPNGQKWIPEKTGLAATSVADIYYSIFIKFEKPIADGNYTIFLPTGDRAKFTRQRQIDISPLFKFNQVGYKPESMQKMAYIGGWLGDAGQLLLNFLNDKKFHILDESGKIVFSAPLIATYSIPVGNLPPYTGEDTFELDFSSFKQPGKFQFYVDGIGRSDFFEMKSSAPGDAFYVHCHGLFQKRCGIAKEKKYTQWYSGRCHVNTYAGYFPPEENHYKKNPRHADFGFFDYAGNQLAIKPFELIDANQNEWKNEKTTVSGGWHDAADFDRRNRHFSVVNELSILYLLRPDSFIDSQLNIPESGNGIPDILDEAIWGMDVWRQAQGKNGGVGTWIEASSHPKIYNPELDTQPYFLAVATRESSLEYAAHAAILALALQKSGNFQEAEKFKKSAVLAWQFALTPGRRVMQAYFCRRTYDKKSKPSKFFYREPVALRVDFLWQAGLSLYALTRENKFLSHLYDNSELEGLYNECSWSWSPARFAVLKFIDEPLPRAVEDFKSFWRKSIVKKADSILERMKVNPYHCPWFELKHPHVKTMGWGNWLPLNQARNLVIAHVLTNEPKYYEAADLALDFHNGANPNGSTLTSGLGKIYPVKFLDLQSVADDFAEYIPGITPYRNAFSVPMAAAGKVYGLFFPERSDCNFPGLKIQLLPNRLAMNENSSAVEIRRKIDDSMPILRRWMNVEAYSVEVSEYTVWETISPAIFVTGYLMNPGYKPPESLLNRKPCSDIRDLPGYMPLP